MQKNIAMHKVEAEIFKSNRVLKFDRKIGRPGGEKAL